MVLLDVYGADGSLFVPTRHSHSGKEETAEEADWDHHIWSYNVAREGKWTNGETLTDTGVTPGDRCREIQAETQGITRLDSWFQPNSFCDAQGNGIPVNRENHKGFHFCDLAGKVPIKGLLDGTKLPDFLGLPPFFSLRQRRITQSEGKSIPNEDILCSLSEVPDTLCQASGQPCTDEALLAAVAEHPEPPEYHTLYGKLEPKPEEEQDRYEMGYADHPMNFTITKISFPGYPCSTEYQPCMLDGLPEPPAGTTRERLELADGRVFVTDLMPGAAYTAAAFA